MKTVVTKDDSHAEDNRMLGGSDGKMKTVVKKDDNHGEHSKMLGGSDGDD